MTLSNHIACCPICGSRVRTYVQMAVVQNNDGDWEWEFEPTAEDLGDAINNVNQEVECTNHRCGTATDCFGNKIPEEARDNLFEYWKQNIINNENIIPANIDLKDLEELDPELIIRYQQWTDSIMYEPWTGVLGECIDLQGRTFQEIADSERVGK